MPVTRRLPYWSDRPIALPFSELSELNPGRKYLGSVAYGGSANLPNPTIVRVSTP